MQGTASVSQHLVRTALLIRARSKWEDALRDWAKPPGITADQKTENAVRMIKHAVADHPSLCRRGTRIFAQGSYRNNTNIPDDSDVDVCILCTDVLIPEYGSTGFGAATFGRVPTTYGYDTFKNEVHDALEYKFGLRSVKRKDKHFDVHENSYRLDADVVACFEYRRYVGDGTFSYWEGTHFVSDHGQETINWPDHHYENGVAKNTATGLRFKYIVRALKRLRSEMDSVGIAEAHDIASFLIESLVWNAPNSCFASEYYTDNLIEVLLWCCDALGRTGTASRLLEVNSLKPLFGPGQGWTVGDAQRFLVAAANQFGVK